MTEIRKKCGLEEVSSFNSEEIILNSGPVGCGGRGLGQTSHRPTVIYSESRAEMEGT